MIEQLARIMPLGDQGSLPEWIRLLPLGKISLSDGREPFNLDLESAESMVQKFRARGIDMVIDYEHQSLGGERAPAAGWIKEMQARPDGLWGRVEWTPQGSEYLKNKEYRYFSPVLRLDPETRTPTALMHVGLTNVPAINRLAPLVAKAAADHKEAGGDARPTKQEAANAMIEKLKQLLGLSGEQGEGEILALAEQRFKLADDAASLPEIATVLALKADASVSEIIGTIKGLKSNQDRLAAVETELTALKAAQTLSEAVAAVDEAIAAKKITPAMREIKLKQAQRDLAEFKAEMAVVPVVLAEVGLKIPASDNKPGGVLDEVGLAVCKQLGIKPEAHLATKQQMAQN